MPEPLSGLHCTLLLPGFLLVDQESHVVIPHGVRVQPLQLTHRGVVGDKQRQGLHLQHTHGARVGPDVVFKQLHRAAVL